MRMLSTFVVVLSSALLFAGCSSVKLSDKPPVEERSGNASNAGADSRTVSTVNANSATEPLNDPKDNKNKHNNKKNHNSKENKKEFKPVIEAHARYLTANKSRKIII